MTALNIIKAAICEGRQFTPTDGGFTVLSDAMMPSGALIRVCFQLRMDSLFAHDDGAAFDELSRHGGEIKSMKGIRGMLAKTNFRLTDDGRIWRDRLPIDMAFDAISLVSDASVRAANFLIQHSTSPLMTPLDQRLKDVMRRHFPQGRVNPRIQGKHRQHNFDFELREGDHTFVLQAVTPDPASVSSAIVKGIDAREAPDARLFPILVFDAADKWQGENLNLLSFGGLGVEIGAVQRGEFRQAA